MLFVHGFYRSDWPLPARSGNDAQADTQIWLEPANFRQTRGQTRSAFPCTCSLARNKGVGRAFRVPEFLSSP